MSTQNARGLGSIIVPCWNQVEFTRQSISRNPNLPRCLGSVRGAFGEIIVVSTGSKDRTREAARSFGVKVIDFAWVDSFAAVLSSAHFVEHLDQVSTPRGHQQVAAGVGKSRDAQMNEQPQCAGTGCLARIGYG
jgi:glycosyltransferase involved in cell wall biosynthesis